MRHTGLELHTIEQFANLHDGTVYIFKFSNLPYFSGVVILPSLFPFKLQDVSMISGVKITHVI